MKKLIWIGLLLLAASCERQTDWDLQSSEDLPLVVVGGITDETKAHMICLSMPASDLNTAPEPVSQAQVTVTDGTDTWVFTEDDSLRGTYYSDSSVHGTPGRNYTLQIKTKTESYQATDYMPSNTWFSPLKYSRNSDGWFQITWVANAYSPTIAALYEIIIDWSGVHGYEDSVAADCRARLYYCTLTSIDVSELFKPEWDQVTFPAGTVITERRYSLSPAHEDFMRSLLIETSWRGGLFDATAANLPTNLSAGAVGFFSASSVYSITINVVP